MLTMPVLTSTSTQQQWVACVQPPSGIAKSARASTSSASGGQMRARSHADAGRPRALHRAAEHSTSRGSSSWRSAKASSDPLAQHRRRAHDGTAGERRGPAPAGADGVERRDVRVAVHDPTLLDRDAEAVGRELRQRGLVALAVRLLAGEHAHGPVALEPGPRLLGRPR